MFAHIDTSSGFQFFNGHMRKFSVVRIFSGTEVNVSVAFISKSFFHQGLNHIQYPLYVFGGPRMYGSLSYIQSSSVDFIFLNVFFRNFRYGGAFLVCPADKLIINVSEVLHKGDLVSPIFKITAQHIKHTHRARIPHMNIIVNGRSADIHFDFTLREREKLLLFAG